MKLISIKGKIRSPIKHVYDCMIDIDYLKSELKLINKNSEQKLRLNYDHKAPFSIGNKVILKGKKSNIIMIVEENTTPKYLKLKVTLGKKITKYVGAAISETTLSQNGEVTQYESIIYSEKEPKGILKVVIIVTVFFMKLSAWSAYRRFISFVHKTA